MIENNISIREIEALVKEKISRAEKVIENTLMYIGETCVNEARYNGDYIDRTGNLRSSIGYVVINNGKRVNENFKLSNKGSDKSAGLSAGRRFMDELIMRYSQGIVLIVIAGMNYAACVESKRNVLASAEILKEREVPRMLKEIGFDKL